MCYLGIHSYINQKLVKYLQREQIEKDLLLMLTSEATKILVPALIEWTKESHQISQQFACGATEDFRS